MPFIPALNVVQAELVYDFAGETVENVLHYEAAGALSIPNMEELGLHLIDWYDNALNALHANTVKLVNVKLTDMTTFNAPGLDVNAGLPKLGTNISAALPNNVAMAISKRTIFRGRSYRGRLYHFGLTENQVVDNTVASGVVTALINAYTPLIAFSTTSESWQLSVVSKFSGNAPRTVAEVTPVVNLTSDGVVDSQRRRLPKRGQ